MHSFVDIICDMGNKGRFHILLFTTVVLALIFGYQNCQQSHLPIMNSANQGSSSTQVVVFTSNLSDYSAMPLESGYETYNYTDMLYQKVIGLGSGGSGCAGELRIFNPSLTNFPCTQLTMLSTPGTGWTYDTSTKIWTASPLPLKQWHGRTWKLNYKAENENYINTKFVRVKSIAESPTTDIMVFATTDPSGLDVIGPNIKTNDFIFYTHIKNGSRDTSGTQATYVCNWVKKCTPQPSNPDSCENPAARTNPTNPCATSIPGANTPQWLLVGSLPSTRFINNGGNASILTFQNNAKDFHVTDTDFYIYKNGTKYGPFPINYMAP